jgi:GNAT superfamily N-acetyltransferase
LDFKAQALINLAMKKLDLENGYYQLPTGKLANIVICLEMLAPPRGQRHPMPTASHLRKIDAGDLAQYRALFRKVGEDWLWFSRLIMVDEKLRAILSHPDVESFALTNDGEDVGVLELDFREPGSCELAFFGLAQKAMGQGLGRALMQQAFDRAWARPISRLWVHTCSYDSPNALSFYLRSGFRAYARMIEIHDDPRISGHLPHDASPQVPVIE